MSDIWVKISKPYIFVSHAFDITEKENRMHIFNIVWRQANTEFNTLYTLSAI